jgi:chromosome segregation ATPase
MEKDTIHQLISDKNKELERNTLRDAERVIDQIAKQQEIIQTAETKIQELRKELRELEIKQIDAKSILGHE